MSINRNVEQYQHHILPLYTDQGDNIDETIKQVAQSVNQTLLMTSTDNPTSNLSLNNLPYDRIPNRQSILDPNPSAIHTQSHSQLIPTDQPHLKTALHIQLQILNKPNKL